MRCALLIGSVLLGCSSVQTPPSPAPVVPVAGPSAPTPTGGPCQVRNEGFAGVSVTDITYDDAGRRSRQVVIDGASIRTHTFEYDKGVLVREDVHDAQQDRVVVRRTRTYEPSGVLRERDESRWHDGGFVVVDHHALHYDEADAFVFELRTQTPLDGPKLVHSITVDVDSQGRVIARRVDEGMTGTFERVSLYSYAEHGGLATLTEMKGEALHTVSRHTYDEQARLVRTEVEDGQGKRVGMTTYVFSCPG